MSAYNTVIQVRFGHVDPAGIAYFPRIFDYVHDVFEGLWEEHVGRRYYHLLQEQRVGFPLVHSEVDFSTPLRFGDRPVVSVTCFKLGRTSLGLRYRFHLAPTRGPDARTREPDARPREPDARASIPRRGPPPAPGVAPGARASARTF
ncbi:acyl-CoA thioesterase [Planctomycetota bacterium]|nr:acyl-CoA thioesterase [Planctomycetota bacterium]